MTLTEELRKGLDERAVKYTETIVSEGVLFNVVTGDEYYFILVRKNNAGIEMWSQYLTPAKAIAVTVGEEGNVPETKYQMALDELREAKMDAERWERIAHDHASLCDSLMKMNAVKELYHHRALLFSVIVHNYRDMCWKSKRHDDGKELDWNFIVGIDTPWGQASYYYGMEYWDMFDCKVLERAPRYDGYTPEQSVERIARLVELDDATVSAGTCHIELTTDMEHESR